MARIRARAEYGLAAVLLVAGVVRFWGLGYGLPHSFYPDESTVMGDSLAMASSGDLRPSQFLYPSLWLYVLVLSLKLGLGLSSVDGLSQAPPGAVYWIGRSVTALAGVASVLVLYLLARRFLTALGAPNPRAYALAAAGFFALSPLHIQHSHVASPDVPTTGLLVMAAYFTLRILEDGRARWYLLAGLATGLASAVKYPSAVFAVSIVVAHLAESGVGLRRLLRGPAALVDWRLWAAGLVTIGSFLVASPYIVIDWASFRSDFMSQAVRVLSRGPVGDVGLTGPYASILYLPLTLHWGLDTPVAILAAVGLGWSVGLGIRRGRTAAGGTSVGCVLLTFLAFPCILAVFSVSWQHRFGRYLLPLIPFACVLASLGLVWLAGHLPRRFPAGRVVAAVAVAALLWQADGVVRYDLLLTREDTRAVAAAWMAANLPREERVVVEWYGPPHSNVRQMEFNLANRSVDRYRRDGVRYIATSSFVYRRWFADPDRHRERVAFYRSLDDDAHLLFAATPTPDLGYDPVQEGWNGWHGIPLGPEARPGPHIRVYELTR
jgi:4-amino-4-deoxy-L-arabinose transferase-like glycosyltransferase